MPRFVVLAHDYPELHWDFMLEKEAQLRTWRLSRPPSEQGVIPALALGDHRLAYLDYEGAVGGDRGAVRRVDRGEYALTAEADREVAVRLAGEVLRGTAVLQRGDQPDAWTFQFTPDGGSSAT